MKTTRVLLVANYGSFNGLTEEQKDFVRERGMDPDSEPWENHRHHPVYLEMFDHFKDPRTGLMTGSVPKKGWGSLPGYMKASEITGDTYTILEYDGKEKVMTPKDFDWRDISRI